MILKPIDCVIDNLAPSKGIIIGLQTMTILGYRLFIDEVPANHHETQRFQIFRSDTMREDNDDVPEEPFEEEEFVMAITESERKEIENLG